MRPKRELFEFVFSNENKGNTEHSHWAGNILDS